MVDYPLRFSVLMMVSLASLGLWFYSTQTYGWQAVDVELVEKAFVSEGNDYQADGQG